MDLVASASSRAEASSSVSLLSISGLSSFSTQGDEVLFFSILGECDDVSLLSLPWDGVKILREVFSWMISSSFSVSSHTSMLMINQLKVDRCLARYSPRTTTTNLPTNRAPNEPARPMCPRKHIVGQNWLFWAIYPNYLGREEKNT